MNLEELNKHADQYPLGDPKPVNLPELTFWPFMLAWGVLFFFWGLITSLIITGVGVVLMAVSVTGWVQELNHEVETGDHE